MESNNAETIDRIQQLVTLKQPAFLPPGGNVPVVVVPDGYTVESLEKFVFNNHAARPERIVQTVKVLDQSSFIEYYRKFSDSESRTFAYEPDRSVTSVLDYHESANVDQNMISEPRYGAHKLVLSLRHSEEWNIWTGQNNKAMTQQQFAEFLEQYSGGIIDPDPAHMREVADDLQMHSEVDFHSGNRQRDGQQRFGYTETIKSTTKNGELAVPEQFNVNLAVFIGGARIPMKALLRTRLKEQKLSFFYTLIRPEEVMRQAFTAARDEIEIELDLKIINGQVS